MDKRNELEDVYKEEINSSRGINMAKGDKYLEFTNYFMHQRAIGDHKLTLSFSEIDEINKEPFPPITRKYPWGMQHNMATLLVGLRVTLPLIWQINSSFAPIQNVLKDCSRGR